MKQRLPVLLCLLFLVMSSCTTNYYLVTSNDDVDVYSSPEESGFEVNIPSGNVFITRGKSNRRITQYGSIKGYSRPVNIRRQVRLKQSEFGSLVFNERTGYGYRGYVSSSQYSNESSSGRTPSKSSSSGGTVNVRGYTRKDGTYVRPHTRSAPRRH